MEQARVVEIVPLTTDDRDMLLTVYETRLRYLFFVYIFLVTAALFPVLKDTAFIGYSGNDLFRVIIIESGVPEFVIIGSGIFFLFQRIIPFRRDLRSGVKEKIAYTIVRKECFPLTDQYFVAFDDPLYMHHEIDEDTWNKCAEGEPMYLYRAIHSKYTFEINGKFSIT